MTPQRRRWAVLAVLSGSLLIIAMDATILNVAFPSLVADLRPTSVEQLWIIDAYALVLSGLLITAGALGDRWGRRRVLVFGFVVFAAASLLAVVATAPWVVIAARALLGVGGAAIMPSTISILRVVFTDPRERAVAYSVWTAVIGAGMALGPLVGGLVVQAQGWESAFLLNVPVAVVCVVLALWLVPESSHPREGRWDWWGVALSVVGMVSLAGGIKLVGGHDVRAGLVLLVVAAVTLTLFVRRELRIANPLLQVRMFANRVFSVSAVSIFLGMMALGAVLFLITQWFQYAKGLGPFAAGLRLLPAPAALVVAPLFTPRLMERFGVRVVLGAGMAVAAVGMAVPWIADVAGRLAYAEIAVALLCLGTGFGIAATAASVALLSSSPQEEAGGAAAVEEISYELGGAMGVAAIGSLAAVLYRGDVPRLGLPGDQAARVRDSIGEAAVVAAQRGGDHGDRIMSAASASFTHALGVAFLAAAILLLASGYVGYRVVPADFRPTENAH
ncbi:MFS transporter [Actinomadura rupiterrae]|uniref:MFS transporter n=1 Tax=Actinomadura rupiterrae TaxID=559627 RepID=UPI0020A2A113|nr:MFS transporter [Actinomadura rupiterrae]MCP2341329.1 DHA2 family multidrug resistance protein-like MFS transporter [Actinomadura rupiterrae]